ncbi:hypothetical protein DE4576_04948 [Mycobacterium marinum]|uniref:hypothetical protein n=1 Tax=Mycobacterium marinum TaxID=1781 RepID=UPI000EE77EAA|nr:hypothetical protein [Mycobacterium marinum]RFZ63009.1 hypothetical protein DE4576_04948 [Mycobacterium marinum]
MYVTDQPTHGTKTCIVERSTAFRDTPRDELDDLTPRSVTSKVPGNSHAASSQSGQISPHMMRGWGPRLAYGVAALDDTATGRVTTCEWFFDLGHVFTIYLENIASAWVNWHKDRKPLQ